MSYAGFAGSSVCGWGVSMAIASSSAVGVEVAAVAALAFFLGGIFGVSINWLDGSSEQW